MYVGSVKIICDANSQIGFGHLQRSLSLASALSSNKIKVHIECLSSEAFNIIPKIFLEEVTPTCIVWDVPPEIEIAKEEYINTHAHAVTIGLDYFGKNIPNINICVYQHYPIRSLNKTYIGLEYTILRYDLLHQKESLKKNQFQDYVLISIGSSDINSSRFHVADTLIKKGHNVVMVEGRFTNASGENRGWTVVKDPDNFIQLMRDANWVVSNGGSTMAEAVFLKKKTFVMPQTTFELNLAQHYLNQKMIMGLSKDFLPMITDDFVECFNLSDTIIDGFGVSRIVNIIKSELSNQL
jgi:spore coat polysaccharide biosynthesis predicted glycosyltransferase SpsG